jgi:hypothetical protein
MILKPLAANNLLERSWSLIQIEDLDDALWGGIRIRNLCAGLLASLEHLVNLLYGGFSLFVAFLDFPQTFLNELAVLCDDLELLELVIGLGLTNPDVIIDYCLHYRIRLITIRTYPGFSTC